VHGDGLQSRDFTYVADVVQANLLAAEAPRVSGKVYNIAYGRQTTLLQVIEMVNGILGTLIRPAHAEARPGDVRHSLADIRNARTELGYSPCTALEQGLRLCINHFRLPPPGRVTGGGVIPQLT